MHIAFNTVDMTFDISKSDDCNFIKKLIRSFIDSAIIAISENKTEEPDAPHLHDFRVINRFPYFNIIFDNYLDTNAKIFKKILDDEKVFIAISEYDIMFNRGFKISFSQFNGTIMPYCVSIELDD